MTTLPTPPDVEQRHELARLRAENARLREHLAAVCEAVDALLGPVPERPADEATARVHLAVIAAYGALMESPRCPA